MPHLYTSFSAKELSNEWLFCGKSCATQGIPYHADMREMWYHLSTHMVSFEYQICQEDVRNAHTASSLYVIFYKKVSSAKEPLIIGLFCGKWPVKMRHQMCQEDVRNARSISAHILPGHFPRNSPIISGCFLRISAYYIQCVKNMCVMCAQFGDQTCGCWCDNEFDTGVCLFCRILSLFSCKRDPEFWCDNQLCLHGRATSLIPVYVSFAEYCLFSLAKETQNFDSTLNCVCTDVQREVGGWGRDPQKCTGRDWGMGSSTI